MRKTTDAAPAIPPALALFTAVCALSIAGPIIRFTDAPALAVAAWRLTLSVVVIGVVILARPQSRAFPRLTTAEWGLALLSGTLLAVHFWTWFESLNMTSVASSVVLVNTQPIFVAILSGIFLKERASAVQWLGIAVAVGGAAVIGWGDHRGAVAGSLAGDLLAVLAAVFVSVYFVIGRRLRQRLDLWQYVGLVYGAAALVLLTAVAIHPGVDLVGYAPRDWLIFATLAAGPMMLGHTGVNYALRYVRAYVANLVILGEAVGATLIAWWLPQIGETPGATTLVGGGLILAGIAIGAAAGRGESSQPDMAAPSAPTHS